MKCLERLLLTADGVVAAAEAADGVPAVAIVVDPGVTVVAAVGALHFRLTVATLWALLVVGPV